VDFMNSVDNPNQTWFRSHTGNPASGENSAFVGRTIPADEQEYPIRYSSAIHSKRAIKQFIFMHLCGRVDRLIAGRDPENSLTSSLMFSRRLLAVRMMSSPRSYIGWLRHLRLR
jgi:hypothetical protein